ncbi:MAG: hypothetical protein HOK24_22415, partial [Desulfobacula sp.]|nr:hypothetical protein [Desulfobacula sp.]
NRILGKYGDCAAHMMEDGATPYEIDAAIVEFGYPMGLHAMYDLAGLDIGYFTVSLATGDKTRQCIVPCQPCHCTADHGTFRRSHGSGCQSQIHGCGGAPVNDLGTLLGQLTQNDSGQYFGIVIDKGSCQCHGR